MGPGSGRYIAKNRLISMFTFTKGESGVYNAMQKNGRPFQLKPIANGPLDIGGFVWTFPDEYPLFEARFARRVVSRRSRKAAYVKFQRMKPMRSGSVGSDTSVEMVPEGPLHSWEDEMTKNIRLG